MSIEERIEHLEGSTTALLDAVSTRKAVLDNAVDTAEAAKVVATSKAAEATTVVADASTHATNASNSATQAAASAASASQIVTGVATGLPNIRPSLNLDFVNSKRVDPRIDFTRSTTATYYDGKTVAKAEENLFNESNPGQWGKARASSTNNVAVAPDGTTTASALIADTSTDTHLCLRSSRSQQGKTHIFSVYLKAGTDSWASLSGYSGTTGGVGEAYFDLANGVVGTTVAGAVTREIYNVGNGWYRCVLIVDPSEVTASVDLTWYIWIRKGDGVTAGFTGDGTSESIYMWGAQSEVRDSVTAYTPTTGSPITNYVPVLQTAGINEPRLDHDPVTGECKGLLIESDRTNYVNSSSIFTLSGGDWGYKSYVTSQNNVTIAPDGTLTAGKIMPTGSNHRFAGHMSLQGSMVTGATYTISGFYKHDGSYWTRIKLGGVFGGEAAVFDFILGEFVGTETNVTRTSATDVGDGWWRLSVTYVFQNHINNLYPYALVAQCKQANGSTTPLDSAEYNGVYIWGMQFEQAPFPSSYIPTDGATVTRADEAASMDLSSLSLGNELSYVVSASKELAAAGWARYLTLADGANINLTYASLNPNGHLYFETKHRNVIVTSTYRQYDIEDGETVTFGASLANDQMVYNTSGGGAYVDSTGRSPVDITRFILHNVGNQHTKNFKLYNQAISASELQALTQE